VKRGEIWTMAGGPGYASKPRPVLIVRDDAFAARNSVTVCLITSDAADLPVFLGLAR
jgi:mRNA interferase MazF